MLQFTNSYHRYLEFIKSTLKLKEEETSLLKYYLINKFLMKKYLFSMNTLHANLSNSHQPHIFTQISRALYLSFSTACALLTSIPFLQVSYVEINTEFFRDIGAKIFNTPKSYLEKLSILEDFTVSIPNPLALLSSLINNNTTYQFINLPDC